MRIRTGQDRGRDRNGADEEASATSLPTWPACPDTQRGRCVGGREPLLTDFWGRLERWIGGPIKGLGTTVKLCRRDGPWAGVISETGAADAACRTSDSLFIGWRAHHLDGLPRAPTLCLGCVSWSWHGCAADSKMRLVARGPAWWITHEYAACGWQMASCHSRLVAWEQLVVESRRRGPPVKLGSK